MKKATTVLIAFLLIVNYSCKEKIDYEKDKKAILALIDEETASYYASDFERWSAVHIQDSTAIRMAASKSSLSLMLGWDSIASNMKTSIENKREFQKELKTPIRIKIYGESAWILFENEYPSTAKMLMTNFLEKHDGKWKIVYRNYISADSYTQADGFIINSINFAKSLGKTVEDIASFTGDQYKTGWNQAAGFNGFVNNVLYNWRIVVPLGELKVQERDDNHIIFSATKMFTGLKRSPQFNVTYDEYLTFYRIVLEKIADYMGTIYTQETTQDGVKVTITKK